MAWPTRPTMAVGTPLLAEDLDAQNDQIETNSGILDAWSTYTPTWTASAGTPSIGNGSLSGRYKKNGRTAHLAIQLTAGSTTSYGTAGAYWIFSLPAGHTAAATAVGTALGLDAAVSEYGGYCRLNSGGTTIELFKPVSGRWVNNSPWTFGNGDQLWISLTYETTT